MDLTSRTSSKNPLQEEEIASSTKENTLISSPAFGLLHLYPFLVRILTARVDVGGKQRKRKSRQEGNYSSFTQPTILLDIKQCL